MVLTVNCNYEDMIGSYSIKVWFSSLQILRQTTSKKIQMHEALVNSTGGPIWNCYVSDREYRLSFVFRGFLYYSGLTTKPRPLGLLMSAHVRCTPYFPSTYQLGTMVTPARRQ